VLDERGCHITCPVRGAFEAVLAEGASGLAITVTGTHAERTITWSRLSAPAENSLRYWV